MKTHKLLIFIVAMTAILSGTGAGAASLKQKYSVVINGDFIKIDPKVAQAVGGNARVVNFPNGPQIFTTCQDVSSPKAEEIRKRMRTSFIYRTDLRLDYTPIFAAGRLVNCISDAKLVEGQRKFQPEAFEDHRITSVEELGLQAPYDRVVSPGEPCDINKDVVITNERYSNGIFPRLISKCDSTRIGWVSVTIDAGKLVPDTVLGASNADADPYDMRLLLGIEDLHFNALERFVARHTMNEGPKGYINIYTCGASRMDELNKQPLPQGYSTDAKANFEKLMAAAKAGKQVRLDLLFNEWVMSGKCLGGIEILN